MIAHAHHWLIEANAPAPGADVAAPRLLQASCRDCGALRQFYAAGVQERNTPSLVHRRYPKARAR